jgi:hypothetical protein
LWIGKTFFLVLGAVVCAFVLEVSPAVAQHKDQIAPTLSGARRRFATIIPRGQKVAASRQISPASAAGFDSIRNFAGEFQVAGLDAAGNPRRDWFYTMAGGDPDLGGTTSFNAPIIPVSLDLLDYDGRVRVVNGHALHYSVKPFVGPVVNSPVFQNADYTSSDTPTQFADAIQRAEFYNQMQPNWHTLLRPSIKAEPTMSIPRGSYYFALSPDGSCCAFVLVDIRAFSKLLFPAAPNDVTALVAAAERSGEIATADISTFLFPNTYLYLDGNPNHCCVLGFHTYDSEPGDTANQFHEKRYVFNYSSWISPGLFAPGFEDITALSHEITESLNDPFVGSDGVHGITPWWLSQNGNCQDDIEVGDVIEGLPDATVAITIGGRTFHPQNEALLPWFEVQSPSSALGGAYSYPNQNVLTALSPPQSVNCQ